MNTTDTKLKHVAILSAGGTPPVDDPEMWDSDGLPWVAIGDMSSGAPVTSTERRVSRKGISTKSLPLGHEGTTLFAMYASVGATAKLGTAATWNQALLGVIGVTEKADDRFIRYWLDHLRPMLGSLYRSNTQDNLNADQVANLPFPGLSIAEQRRIADFLDAETSRIDSLVASRRGQLPLIEERWCAVLTQVYATLLRDHGGVRLGLHMHGIEQGSSPLADNVPASIDEWGVLKVGAVKFGKFVPAENKRLPEGVEPERRYEVKPGDFLITRANTPKLVGDATVVPANIRPQLQLCDKIFRLRLSDHLDANFVALMSQSTPIRALREATATGASSSMVNITNDEVRSWLIPLPGMHTQKMAVDGLRRERARSDDLAEIIAGQLALLEERRQALITAAVTGQLDVTTARGAAERAL